MTVKFVSHFQMSFWGMCYLFICTTFSIWDQNINTENTGEAEVPSNLAVSYICRVYSFLCVNKLFFTELKKHLEGRKTLKDKFCKHFFIFIFTAKDKYTNAFPSSVPSLSNCILAFTVSSPGCFIEGLETLWMGVNLTLLLLSSGKPCLYWGVPCYIWTPPNLA